MCWENLWNLANAQIKNQSESFVVTVLAFCNCYVSATYATLCCMHMTDQFHHTHVHPQKIMLMKEEKIKNIDCLSLSDSSDDVKPIPYSSHHIKLPPRPTKPQAPLIIDLCSPETKPAVMCGSVVEAPGVVWVGSVYLSLEEAQEAI